MYKNGKLIKQNFTKEFITTINNRGLESTIFRFNYWQATSEAKKTVLFSLKRPNFKKYLLILFIITMPCNFENNLEKLNRLLVIVLISFIVTFVFAIMNRLS